MQCIGTSWHNKQIRGGYFLGKGWVPICGLRWLYISHQLAKYWKNTEFSTSQKHPVQQNTTISRAPRTADLVRYFQNFVGPGPVKCSNFSAGGETDWDRPVFNESWARTPGPVLKTNDPDPEIRKLDSD